MNNAALDCLLLESARNLAYNVIKIVQLICLF